MIVRHVLREKLKVINHLREFGMLSKSMSGEYETCAMSEQVCQTYE
jgi:hypothetical protein